MKLLHGAIQECNDLCSRAAVVGAEGGSGRTVGHAALHGPGHCVSIESIGRHVGEAVHRGGRGAQCAIQERHALRAGAGGVGAEGAVAGTQRDAILHSPGHSLGVVAACGNIREAHRALRRGRAGGAPQEGDDVGAGAGAVGVEGAVAGTAGDTLLGGPLHGLIVVGVGGNVREVQRLDLSEFRGNRHLGGGHGKGKLAVALVLHLDLAAAGVLHGQGVQLIAAVGLDGDGHGIALGGALGADGHIAVLDRGRGDVIASGGGAGTAGGGMRGGRISKCECTGITSHRGDRCIGFHGVTAGDNLSGMGMAVSIQSKCYGAGYGHSLRTICFQPDGLTAVNISHSFSQGRIHHTIDRCNSGGNHKGAKTIGSKGQGLGAGSLSDNTGVIFHGSIAFDVLNAQFINTICNKAGRQFHRNNSRCSNRQFLIPVHF